MSVDLTEAVHLSTIAMTAKSRLFRMDNVLIVVDDLEAATAFFAVLDMELEGETTVEGLSVDSLIGLKDGQGTCSGHPDRRTIARPDNRRPSAGIRSHIIHVLGENS